jgi:hypothetical protein
MNDVLKRLTTIIEEFFENKRPNLARAIGKRPDTLNSYFKQDSIPGGEFLTELWKVGISSDWILTGEGSMYADNEAGRALRKKKQALGKEHEPELLGHLSDMPGYRQHIVNLSDSEVETLESLLTKIKGQTDANLTGT